MNQVEEHEHVAVTVFDGNGKWIDTEEACIHCQNISVYPPYKGYVTVLPMVTTRQ